MLWKSREMNHKQAYIAFIRRSERMHLASLGNGDKIEHRVTISVNIQITRQTQSH